MPLSRDLLLPSLVKSAFSVGNILALEGFLHNGGTVAADFSYNTDVLKAGKSVVY